MSTQSERARDMDSRKFRALVMGIVVYSMPMLLTFVMVQTHNATKEDFKEIVKWMGLALSPILTGYILSVAIEDFGKNRGPSAVSQQTSGPIINENVIAPNSVITDKKD